MVDDIRKIRLAKPYFDEREIIEIRKVLESGWVAQGPQVKQFEQEFADYCGAKHAVAVNSCTSGLYLSLFAQGISKGDKVIVPDFTFVATANAVKQTGADVEIVDVDRETFCMCMPEVEDKIDEHTKAIIPVHVLGYPADIPELNKLTETRNLKIIEDAASGLGSMIGGKKVGSFGNISCYSLQGRKIITTGEGGMITLDSGILEKYLRALRSQGSPSFPCHGYSYRLSDIQAGIGIVQLSRIESFIRRRGYLADLYRDLIYDAGIDVDTPVCKEGVRHTYQAYVVLVSDRDKVIEKMFQKGVETTIGTHSLSSMPLFKNDNICPNGKIIYRDSLTLPMYHELTDDDVRYVVECLKGVVKL